MASRQIGGMRLPDAIRRQQAGGGWFSGDKGSDRGQGDEDRSQQDLAYCKRGRVPAGEAGLSRHFQFQWGGLCSDFVNMDKIHHVFYKMEEGRSPTVVLEADYKEMGVGSFCMRMTCVPSNRSTARRGAILKATTP